MKIGFSFVDLALGGAQTYLVQLAQGLASRGHHLQYFLYARRNDKVHAASTLLAKLDAVAQPVRKVAFLRSNDIIQMDGYHNLRRKLPFLFTLNRCVEVLHSAYSIRHAGPVYAKYRVANSKSVQNMFRLPSHLIYQGIPLPEHYGRAVKSFDLAILGRIHPVKGHLLFLDICEYLVADRVNLSVLIIGGYSSNKEYARLVERKILHLQNQGIRIHLTGDVPYEDVYTWLDQARILLITSQSEGFGRMAAEAMACGLPVIANPVGGLLEIIQHGENGFLTSLNDIQSFSSLAKRTLDDEGLCKQLGQKGRDYVATNYSFQKMLDAYEELYHKVIAG